MRIISQGDALVKSVVGKKALNESKRYRWSVYTVFRQFQGQTYLYNNFTKMCCCPEADIPSDRSRRFTAEEIKASSLLTELAENLFLVHEDADETRDYVNYCKIMRTLKRSKGGYTTFVILPTTACNARCFYCFESGMKYVTMTEETVRQTIAFIKENRNPAKTLTIKWFGGEPLVGESIIDEICAALRSENIAFSSVMTSNGSLITEASAEKMKTEWNLKEVQITLDGIESEYNERKNYRTPYDSAYWHVLSRIKILNERGIRLRIRVNVDEKNIDGILTMFNEVKLFIPNPKLVRFDLAPLYHLQAGGSTEIWQKSLDILDEIERQGYRILERYSVFETGLYYCMAEKPRTSVTIAPDGKIYACENYKTIDTLGDIWNGVTNQELFRSYEAVEPPREKCRGCFSLPDCTTFSRCPSPFTDCRFVNRRRMERALDLMLKNRLSGEKAGEQPVEKDC